MRNLFKLLFLLLPMVAGCAPRALVPPDFLLADAHSSGSRVAVDERGMQVVSGGLDGGMALWDARDGRLLRRWRGHGDTVNGLLFLPGGRRIVSGGWDGQLVIWDLQGRAVARRRVSSPVTALVYQEDPPALWSGHDDGSLRRWNLRLLPQQVRHLPGGHRITALAWADGRLAAADSHGKLWLLESSSEDPPKPFASLPAYLRTLAFDDSGEHLFGGSWFRLYRWDLSTGAMRVLPTAHHGIITALQWNAPRRALFSISRQTDSSVLALDPDNGGTLTDFGQHDLCGADVAVSANGQVLATTSDDGSVRIWRLRSAPPSTTSAGSAHGSGSRP